MSVNDESQPVRHSIELHGGTDNCFSSGPFWATCSCSWVGTQWTTAAGSISDAGAHLVQFRQDL